jgi:hypothetical protein
MFRIALVTVLLPLGAAGMPDRAMAQPIGVPVCDALLERLEACAARLPDDLQDDLRALNANERQLLRDLSKRDAEMICRQNQAGYRRAKLHQEYGCRF